MVMRLWEPCPLCMTYAVGLLAAAANFAVFWFGTIYILRIGALVVGATVLAIQITTFIINARAGCYPWSPKQVEFRQGMTLCPGQTAIIRIEIPTIPQSPNHMNGGT